jgi:hypothetical protein
MDRSVRGRIRGEGVLGLECGGTEAGGFDRHATSRVCTDTLPLSDPSSDPITALPLFLLAPAMQACCCSTAACTAEHTS